MNTWRQGVLLSVVSAVVISTTAAPVWAAGSNTKTKAKAEQSQIGKQISDLRNQANEVSAEGADLLARLNDINARKDALQEQVDNLQAQMNGVQAELNASQARVEELQRQEDQARAALETARVQLAASTQKMQDQAVDAYVGTGQTTNLASLILRAEDMREVSAAGEYLHQIVEERRAIVEEHRELQGQAEDLQQKVEANRAEAQAARDGIAQRQTQLATQKSQLDALTIQAASEANRQAQLLAEVEHKRASLTAEITGLQNQSDSIAAMLRNLSDGGGGAPAPPARPGALSNPVPGAPITSSFGMRQHPILGTYVLHAGMDFGAPNGAPIRAANDGTVVQAGSVSGYGNYTCLSHGGGLATCYAHQSRIMVSNGQRVARGQIIGLVGSTGNSTGAHLHFEVRINGTPVNPAAYL